MIKMQFLFFIKYTWNCLEFGCLHTKIKHIFVFFKWKKGFRFFGIFWNFRGKKRVFLILDQCLIV